MATLMPLRPRHARARVVKYGHDRGTHRHEHRRADPLDHAKGDQRRCCPARRRRGCWQREDREADQVDALESEDLAESTKRQQQATDDQQ